MLEEASDDAAYADTTADAVDARTELASSAHEQFDLHASLRSTIERLNSPFVEQGVYFGNDERGAAGARVGRLALDQAEAILSEIERGNK